MVIFLFLNHILFSDVTCPGLFYLARPIIDTAGRVGEAASLIGLTWIDSHTDASVSTVAFVTRTQVLVWSTVDTGGVGMTGVLDTRVYG